MSQWDRNVFDWINHWPESYSGLFLFFSEAIKSPIVRLVLLALILGLVWAGGKWRRAALLSLVAWPLANGTTDVLKYAFQGIRPSVNYPDAIVRVHHLTSYGTASAHAANMAAIAFVFTACLGWWGSPWIVVALLTGLARIYVGVHYPSQVLLGWVVGTFCGLLVVNTWEAYSRRRSKPAVETVDAESRA